MTTETFIKANLLKEKIESTKENRRSFETMVIDGFGIAIKGAFDHDVHYVRMEKSHLIDTILSMLIDDCDKQIAELEKQFNDL